MATIVAGQIPAPGDEGHGSRGRDWSPWDAQVLALRRADRLDFEELQDAFTLRFDHAGREIYMLPDDIVTNTVRAYSVSATSATGYAGTPPEGRYIAPANGPDCIETAPGFGDCGLNNIVVTGPTLVRFDLSAVKRMPIAGRVNFEFRAELLNAFNTPWFTPVTGVGDDRDDFLVTAGDTGREVQLVFRINW